MSGLRCECLRSLSFGEARCWKCGRTERWISPRAHGWAGICPRLTQLGATFGVVLDTDQALGWSDRFGPRSEAALVKLVAIAQRRRVEDIARSRPPVPEPRQLVPVKPLRDELARQWDSGPARRRVQEGSDRYASDAEALARASGVSRRQINRVTKPNGSDEVEVDTADRLLTALGIPLDTVYPYRGQAA